MEKECKRLNRRIKELEELLRDKKYGLVFEDRTEQEIEEDSNVYLLDRMKRGMIEGGLDITNNKKGKTNYFIEGDNYELLKAMQETHQNKIDLIYIDPPYNTGRQMTYKDSIVNNRSAYSHSEWLNFMKKRLLLARNLLSDDGLFFVSISDKQYAHLKLLMDEIYGEGNFITSLVWIYSYNEVEDGKLKTVGSNLGNIKNVKEHILMYAKDRSKVRIAREDVEGEIRTRITKRGNKRRIIELPKGLRSEIERGIFRREVGGNVEKITLHSPIKIEDYRLVEPVTIEGSFVGVTRIEKLLKGEPVYDRNNQRYKEIVITGQGIPYLIKEKKGELFSDVLSGYGGSTQVKTGDSNFMYPKPIELMKHLIKFHPRKDITVLDFFGGSGTTGQAVMELNDEDGGERVFILNTLDEIPLEDEINYLYNLGYLTEPTKQSYNNFVNENRTQYEILRKQERMKGITISRKITYKNLSNYAHINNENICFMETVKYSDEEYKKLLQDGRGYALHLGLNYLMYDPQTHVYEPEGVQTPNTLKKKVVIGESKIGGIK